MTRSLRVVLPLVLALAAPALAQDRVAPVRTAFDPRLDGMPFENMGDYASPDGNCMGMSLLAVDQFLRRLRARAEGRPDPAPLPITRRPEEGHLEAQVLASLVQAIASDQDDGDNNPADSSSPRNPRALTAALERMRRTGAPELFGMYAADGSAHQVVIFGYEDGHLLVYDPNYPGETIRWPWDPVRGFGPHPKRRDDPGLYGKQVKYDVAPLERFRTARELQALRDACAQGLDRCVGRFHGLSSRLAGTPERPVVAGKVTGGMRRAEDGTRPKRPRKVYVVVDGRAVASAPLKRDGSFEVALPIGMTGRRYQVVVVSDEGHLAGVEDVEGTAGAARSRGLAGVTNGIGE